MKSMGFTVFSYTRIYNTQITTDTHYTIFLIQPNPTKPMDVPSPCPSVNQGMEQFNVIGHNLDFNVTGGCIPMQTQNDSILV